MRSSGGREGGRDGRGWWGRGCSGGRSRRGLRGRQRRWRSSIVGGRRGRTRGGCQCLDRRCWVGRGSGGQWKGKWKKGMGTTELVGFFHL